MKNLFIFPRIEPEDTKRLNQKILKIAGLVLVCFLASLLVRWVIKDRVNRADMALLNLKDIAPFALELPEYHPLTEFTEEENTYYEVSTVTSVDPVRVTISNTSYKELGKQSIVVYEGVVTMTGRVPSSNTKDVLSLDKKYINEKSLKIAFDGEEVSSWISEDAEDVWRFKFPLGKPTGEKSFSLSYHFKGSGYMTFALEDISYDVEVLTDYENIRIGRSDIGTVEDGLVTFNIPSNEVELWNTESPQIHFLSQKDDIQFVDRISKYAILVIVLVFALALYMDMRRKLTINIVQYFLVGVSLVLFYLLTLSLGEHVGYFPAYVVASLTTVVLNWWYIGNVLSSPKYGAVFGIALAILYALLYGMIRVSSVNLLAGTIILYVILMAFMMGSRKMNIVSNKN